MGKLAAAALCVACSLLPVHAGIVEPPAEGFPTPDEPAGPTTAGCCLIEAGTPVELEIVDALNSWEFERGDGFRLQVAEPIRSDGQELIPAGIPVKGEIVHAAAARGGGAPGELLIAARTLEVDGQTLRLRGLKLGRTGQDNSGIAIGVSIAVGPWAMFIRGREIEIPPGTRVHARLAEAVRLVPATPAPDTSPNSTELP